MIPDRYIIQAAMFAKPLHLSKPGLFITGTDTDVGKTVIACAVAKCLKRQFNHVGVCKPIASGCRYEREGLVSDDALALAHFADCRQPLEIINPIRYAQAVAPAVAAAEAGVPGAHGVPHDYDLLARSLQTIDRSNGVVVIEGVGGLCVPLDDKHTVLDLAVALRYPVVIVVRAGLGTLSHTAMTVKLLRASGCRIAGLVINGYEADPINPRDVSMSSNRLWLATMNRVPLLATVPAVKHDRVAVHEGHLPDAILDAVAMTYWPDVVSLAG